ncbi:hypothetical protein AUJ10_01010 [Candidatus Pacearchaeota archaeon CG1_02_31_27]|nr:MAG: hypothetical protein AUJ10_01010 [Candidatus Pacearchaeota archaeon CG1_02_31_27]
MRKIIITVTSFLLGGITYGQAPTGTPPPNINNVNQTSQSAWFRGGNFPVGFAGTNNIFGTMWNSPIYTYTNGIGRTKLNGNISYPVNGFAGNRNGNILLGFSQSNNDLKNNFVGRYF